MHGQMLDCFFVTRQTRLYVAEKSMTWRWNHVLTYPWNTYCPKLKEYIASYLEQVQSGSNQVCPVWLFGLVVFYRLPSNVLLSSKDRPNQNKHCTHMSKAWYLLEILARFWMYYYHLIIIDTKLLILNEKYVCSQITLSRNSKVVKKS